MVKLSIINCNYLKLINSADSQFLLKEKEVILDIMFNTPLVESEFYILLNKLKLVVNNLNKNNQN